MKKNLQKGGKTLEISVARAYIMLAFKVPCLRFWNGRAVESVSELRSWTVKRPRQIKRKFYLGDEENG